MKPMDKGQLVDTKAEIEAIITFISSRWDLGDMDVPAFVEEAFSAGYEAIPDIVPFCSVGLYAHDQADKRKAMLVEDGLEEDFLLYDRPLILLNAVFMNDMELRNQVFKGWNYDRAMSDLYHSLQKKHPALTKASPLGYGKFMEEYEEFDGQREYDSRQDEDAFAGHDASETRSFSLPVSLAMPYVAYDDRCQNRRPGRKLVGVIAGHAMGVREHNNTVELYGEVDNIDLTAPFSGTGEFGELSPWLTKLVAIQPPKMFNLTEKRKTEIREHNAKWAAMSEEEREAERKTNRERLMAELPQILKEIDEEIEAEKNAL